MNYKLDRPTAVQKGRRTDYMVVPAEATNYNWKVTGGRILEGHNMPAITVEWTEDGPQHVEVAVQDHGLDVQKQKLLVKVSDNIDQRMP